MNKIFGEVIRKRRASPGGDHEDDVLDTLLNTTYKWAIMFNNNLEAHVYTII